MAITVVQGARLVGALEWLAEESLGGWACEDGAPARLRVAIDDDWSTVIEARQPRADVAKAGYPAACGFVMKLPGRFLNGRRHHLRITGEASGEVLHDDPSAELITPAGVAYRLWRLEEAVRGGLWHIDPVTRAPGQVSGTGWFLPPRARPLRYGLTVNGIPATVTPLPHPLPPLTEPLDLEGLYDKPQFTFSVALPDAAMPDVLRFSLVDAAGQPFDPLRDVWHDFATVPLPPAHLRRRVQGDDSAVGFDLIGAATAHSIRTAVERHRPGGLAQCGAVLDWGCGCGRPARYLRRWVGGRFVGCDPDPEAVAWCQANLPGAEFAVSRFRPPLPFGDAAFDCIYGISVFTHLSEADQFLWLAELARVLRPGGLLVTTVLGNTAWSRMRRRGTDFLAWREAGFADLGPSGDLGEAFAEATEYRNVSHTRDYVARQWGRGFDLLEYVDGGLGCWQDIVVLQRKG